VLDQVCPDYVLLLLLYDDVIFFILMVQDQLGVVAAISQKIAGRGGNILNVDIHIDLDGGGSPIFYSRR
jgi:ACT domain-containing protein